MLSQCRMEVLCYLNALFTIILSVWVELIKTRTVRFTQRVGSVKWLLMPISEVYRSLLLSHIPPPPPPPAAPAPLLLLLSSSSPLLILSSTPWWRWRASQPPRSSRTRVVSVAAGCTSTPWPNSSLTSRTTTSVSAASSVRRLACSAS